MASATFSEQELLSNYGAAEEATHAGPVFITKDGEPRAVLIDIAEYQKLSGTSVPTRTELSGLPEGVDMVSFLAMDEPYFEWEAPRLEIRFEPADFS